MPEQKRALGCLCPECKKIVLGERTAFALMASAAAVVCDCGRSELTAENDGRVFRLTVPCGLCGGEHRAEVPVSSVLEGSGVALACPKTRQHCCYIGDIRRVRPALESWSSPPAAGRRARPSPTTQSCMKSSLSSRTSPPGTASPAPAAAGVIPWRS